MRQTDSPSSSPQAIRRNRLGRLGHGERNGGAGRSTSRPEGSQSSSTGDDACERVLKMRERAATRTF